MTDPIPDPNCVPAPPPDPPTAEDLARDLRAELAAQRGMNNGEGRSWSRSLYADVGLLRRCVAAEDTIDFAIRYASADPDGEIDPAKRRQLLVSWIDGHEKMVERMGEARDAAEAERDALKARAAALEAVAGAARDAVAGCEGCRGLGQRTRWGFKSAMDETETTWAEDCPQCRRLRDALSAWEAGKKEGVP